MPSHVAIAWCYIRWRQKLMASQGKLSKLQWNLKSPSWKSLFTLYTIKWAVTCDFQQYGILTSVDSDAPVQPPLKLRNSKWCSVSSLTTIEFSRDKQRLWSDCAYAQADLRLCWSHIPYCWKSHVLAQIYYKMTRCITLVLVASEKSWSGSTMFSKQDIWVLRMVHVNIQKRRTRISQHNYLCYTLC